MQEEIIKIIDQRIEKLRKDLGKLPSTIEPKKKIHPANKKFMAGLRS